MTNHPEIKRLRYRLAENFSRDPIRTGEAFLFYCLNIERKKTVPGPDGKGMTVLLPDMTSILWYLFGMGQPDVTCFINNVVTSGSHVINIGAHIGTFTRLAAEKAGPNGKVIAVEPTPRTFTLLKQNCSKIPTITIVQAAAHNSSGQKLIMADFGRRNFSGNRAISHLGESTKHSNLRVPKPKKTFEAETVTLDEIIKSHELRNPVIIIDAERHELEILQGMKVGFQRNRPSAIIAEAQDGIDPNRSDLAKILIENNYSLFGYNRQGISPINNPDCPNSRISTENILARPKELIN